MFRTISYFWCYSVGVKYKIVYEYLFVILDFVRIFTDKINTVVCIIFCITARFAMSLERLLTKQHYLA